MNKTLTRVLKVVCLLPFIALGVLVLPAKGAPVLGTDSFDAPGYDASGWQSVSPDGIATIPHNGGVSDSGYFQLSFPDVGNLGSEYGYIFNNDLNHTGNYSNHIVSFSFWVSPVSDPTVALNFYFKSQSGKTWLLDFQVPENAWTSVSVNFNGLNWSSLNGGIDFMGGVSRVTEIGIHVDHLTANGSAFTYGLDNWTTSIPVPEPESMALALVAFISLLLTFRQPILAFVRKRSRA